MKENEMKMIENERKWMKMIENQRTMKDKWKNNWKKNERK